MPEGWSFGVRLVVDIVVTSICHAVEVRRWLLLLTTGPETLYNHIEDSEPLLLTSLRSEIESTHNNRNLKLRPF